MGTPVPLANCFRELHLYIRYLPKNLSMRHGNRKAKTLKFALPSAVEFLLRFQAFEARRFAKGDRPARKKDGPAQGRPIFMKSR
jgi:hypothetical protein